MPDETYVSPVRGLPVKDVGGCVIGCTARLANGQAYPGVLGNFRLNDPRGNEHFLSLSILLSKGRRFHLARYHDVDVARRGPMALAAILDLPIESVFPITYEIESVVFGSSNAVYGLIAVEPRERLTRQEIISFALARARSAL